MNNSNAPALLRALIVYAICIPLAVTVGYLLANPLDYSSLGFVGVMVALLLFPLLLRWHYQLLLLCAGLPLVLFFIKGSPNIFLVMVLASLTVSVLDRILSKRSQFISVPAMTWPLIFMLAVVFITAELTGGIGLHATGSDVYGGKKYVTLVCGILGYFAITARAIPPDKARLYVSLFLAGGLLNFISDLYVVTPSFLQFIFYFFPPNLYQDTSVEIGTTRLGGIGFTGLSGLVWMLARYGIRGTLLTRKFWRPALFFFFIALMLLGGYRVALIIFTLLFTFLFIFEKLYHTALLPLFIGGAVMGGVLLIPLAHHLPYTYQRALAILPLDLDPIAVADAEGTSDWRINMWRDLLPQIPQYLLVGKGYAIRPEDFNEMMGRDTAFHEVDSSQIGLALAGDYHNGPLSVILPFGIWGTVVFLWFLGGCWYVIRNNYRHGLPELHQLNAFLLAYFLAKCVVFFLVIGAMQNDMGSLAQLAGLSVAINHGVRRKIWPATDQPYQRTASLPAVPEFNPFGQP